MSWDAYLTCDSCGHCIGSWDYTHNTNNMIRDAGFYGWWDEFHGMTGPEGAAILDSVIRTMTSDPERFRAQNPSNGWGSYDSLLPVLVAMRDSVPETPTHWSVHG